MPISPSRQLAYRILEAVEERAAFASELLHAPVARRLISADRRLATEIVMGVLRWRGQLDYLIERGSRRRIGDLDLGVRIALRMGLYQLRFLDRVPAMAAVHESVELVKQHVHPRAAGLVNAVLRRASSEPIQVLLQQERDPVRREAAEFSHPAWLLERWSRRFGPEATRRIAEYDNMAPPVAVRLDSSRVTREAALLQLQRDKILATPGALTGGALLIASGDVTQHSLYQGGDLWIQDEASQLVALLLEPQPSELLLDACAAPGGKTAVLRTRAPGACVMAMDRHPHRARLLARLHETRQSWVIAADATQPLPVHAQFDRILVDAPCSGTGTLARNPEIRWRLKPNDLSRLQQVQLAILSNVVNWLRPGGRLLYSVCSLEAEEGPAVVTEFLARHQNLRPIPADSILQRLRASGDWTGPDEPGLVQQNCFQTLPGVHSCDGFFAAVFEKAGPAGNL